jgi:hypothetical protein
MGTRSSGGMDIVSNGEVAMGGSSIGMNPVMNQGMN